MLSHAPVDFSTAAPRLRGVESALWFAGVATLCLIKVELLVLNLEISRIGKIF